MSETTTRNIYKRYRIRIGDLTVGDLVEIEHPGVKGIYAAAVTAIQTFSNGHVAVQLGDDYMLTAPRDRLAWLLVYPTDQRYQ